jgi:predicted nucleic acid-binding protein
VPFATLSGETGLQFERLAFDANAAIDSLRPDRPFPQPLKASRELLMPLFVLAELRLGVMRSKRREENAAAVEDLTRRCRLLTPDNVTVEFYVRVRNDVGRVRTVPQTLERREGFGHDLWIAALCLQHDVPLLTNDSLFDDVSGLRVVNW